MMEKQLLLRVKKLEKLVVDLYKKLRNNTQEGESYSETEVLTGGTWIDGKFIYRKVIPFTVPSVSDAATGVGVIHNLNVDKYLKVEGLPSIPVENTSQDCAWLFPLFGSNPANLALNLTGGIVMFNKNNITFESVKSAITSTNDFLLIVEYTKV